jgi:electron transport complex protein RnfB
MSRITPEDIDAILPQTQCGLCGYGGCLPYAEALIFEGAAINLCPPGGVKTLQQLGSLLAQDPTPYTTEMQQKAKPNMRAVIREAECIGCTKCIQACPVDAILGGAKQMHTVIASECTGCELCVAPCPVDCIDMQVIADNQNEITYDRQLARQRFQAREKRLKQEKLSQDKKNIISLKEKQAYIQAAIARAKAKK